MGQRPQAKHGKISQRGQIDAEWRKTLTPEEFRVTREQRAFVIAITKRSARECITVSVTALHCSAPGPNMIQALAGQAFMPHQYATP